VNGYLYKGIYSSILEHTFMIFQSTTYLWTRLTFLITLRGA